MTFKHLNSIFQLVKTERKGIINLYFYAILGGCLQLSVPVGIQAILGFVTGASMSSSIYILIIGLVVAVALVGTLTISQMKQVEEIQRHIFANNAIGFAEAFPRFNLKSTDQYYLPEKANRFFETVTLQKGFSKMLLDIPQASIQIILGMLLISLYHPLFIIFSIVLLMVLVALFALTGNKGIMTSHAESNYKYALVDWLEEIARSIRAFKFSQGSHLNLKRADDHLSDYLEARQDHFRVLLLQYRTLLIVKVLITAGMLITGSYLLVNQKLNIGEFIAAEIVILSIISAVEKLIVNLDNIYDVVTAVDKLSSVLHLENEPEGQIELVTHNKGISIDIQHLRFAYKNEKPCLDNINFSASSSSITLIQGEEGSGKSTLLRILSGHYREFEGSILMNDIPLNNYSLHSLRNHIGHFWYAPDTIFKGTLMENITMGHEGITAQEIYELTNRLKFDSDLLKQGDGLNTILSSQGQRLTSSQIHHILLLRTFIRKPSLLLMEEPFTHLNEVQIKALSDYLKELKHTTILVSMQDATLLPFSSQQITLKKQLTRDS